MYHDSVKGTKVELLNMMVLEIIDRTKITFSSIHISDYKQVWVLYIVMKARF